MNLIELTTSLTETFIINLDHVAAIKRGVGVSDSTGYATVMLSSGQSIPISETDFNRIICQLTDQYFICAVED